MLTMAAMPISSRITAVISVSETGKLLSRMDQSRRRHRLALLAQADMNCTW